MPSSARVRGDSATPLYWNQPDKSAATIRERVGSTPRPLHARFRRLLFLSRPADDLVKISGQWVYPLEIELCLAEHPDLRECAVFASELPDRRMTLKAVVVMNASAFDEDEATKNLQDFVKAKLLPYKYPREVIFIDELPETGTGKIDRQALMHS
jgi:acyl-coenzyme A synthetase/AMP-(fatty) acid ligase